MFRFFKREKRGTNVPEQPSVPPMPKVQNTELQIREWTAEYFVPQSEMRHLIPGLVKNKLANQMFEDLLEDMTVTKAMDPERGGYVFRARMKIAKEK
jgi:hypothetical protein